ncbi:MAG: hypothetical protein ACXWV2_05255 [Chitinophagaceae bacterium]
MRNSILLWILIVTITIPASSLAIEVIDTSKPRYRNVLHDLQNKRYQGLLINTNPTSVSIFPGLFNSWKTHNDLQPLTVQVHNIQKIQHQKKNALLDGTIIGTGIGLLPMLIRSIVWKGQGRAYACIPAFPHVPDDWRYH